MTCGSSERAVTTLRAVAVSALSVAMLAWMPAASTDAGAPERDYTEYVFMHQTLSGLFSATGPVIAILAGELYVGEAEGHLGGHGTLAIRAQKDPALTCLGQFTSDAEPGGSGKLACSDGNTATFRFRRLSTFRGHGSGTMNRGSLSFAYGLTHDEARPYLRLPEGKKLVHNGTELAMVDR